VESAAEMVRRVPRTYTTGAKWALAVRCLAAEVSAVNGLKNVKRVVSENNELIKLLIFYYNACAAGDVRVHLMIFIP